MLMKKLIYALAALLIAGGAYWVVFEQCSKKEPVVEAPTETTEDVEVIEADSVEVVEITIDETENEETNVELNTVETNE